MDSVQIGAARTHCAGSIICCTTVTRGWWMTHFFNRSRFSLQILQFASRVLTQALKPNSDWAFTAQSKTTSLWFSSPWVSRRLMGTRLAPILFT